MKILITGGSSFTGYWFVRELASAGHTVVAAARGKRESYQGLRGERVDRLVEHADVEWECAFGDPHFLDLISSGSFEVLCHHGALVENYKSMDFEVARAVAENTLNLGKILEVGLRRGLESVVLTGSVFEQGEGAGEQPRQAFSPYGLSKGMTADAFRFWCAHFRVPLGKFVIPNPFGPLEEPRFCAYLLKTWASGKTATVNTPLYVRDNIHVSLLAKAYASFVGKHTNEPFRRLRPSGYVEAQGSFAQRFAKEIGDRLDLECSLELAKQTEFGEPHVRINTNQLNLGSLEWDECGAWNDLAAYYRTVYLAPKS